MLQLNVDSLDGLEPNISECYEAVDGKFRLKVEGLDDTGALKRAKEHEKTARMQAENDAKEAKRQLDELQKSVAAQSDDDARDKGDTAALEASWQDKLTKREDSLNGEIATLNTAVRSLTVDREAIRMASEIAVEGSADVLLPHIKSRLAADQKDGQFVTVVNDVNGKPSALTVSELQTEFINNPTFAPVIVASKGKGSGAGSSKPGGAAHGGDLSKMTREEKLTHFKQE